MSNGLILITGGSRGIGKGIAEELASAGYDIVLLAKNEKNLMQTKDQILTKHKVKIDTISCDLSDTREIDNAFNYCKRQGYKFTSIAHSAGIFIEGCNLSSTIDVYDAMMDVNLRAIYYFTRLFKPLLDTSKKCTIVIIGSTAGLEPYTIGSIYGIAKWGLKGYAVNLRQELAKDGIGVVLVNPGSTFTDLWKGTAHPKSRFVQPNDIGIMVRACLSLSADAIVDEITVRPLLGDIHDE